MIDQSVDDISPVQYLNVSGGVPRTRSDHIHYNLTQQLTGSYQKTRNTYGAQSAAVNNSASSKDGRSAPVGGQGGSF